MFPYTGSTGELCRSEGIVINCAHCHLKNSRDQPLVTGVGNLISMHEIDTEFVLDS